MRLNHIFRLAVYGAFGVLFLSGAAWPIADGLKDSADGEFWQTVSANLLMVHGGVAMLALMLTGALVPIHVLRSWRAKKNRITGIAMASLIAILILTAFGLYYLGSETLRPRISDIHLALGCALPVALTTHIYFGRRSASLAKAALAGAPARAM